MEAVIRGEADHGFEVVLSHGRASDARLRQDSSFGWTHRLRVGRA